MKLNKLMMWASPQRPVLLGPSLVSGQQRLAVFSPSLPSGDKTSAQRGRRGPIQPWGRRRQDALTCCLEPCCGMWQPWLSALLKDVFQGQRGGRRLRAPTSGGWEVGLRRGGLRLSLQVLCRWPLCSSFSAAKRGVGRVGRLPPPGRKTSELLQAAVHLPLALLPGPGPALGAEFLQVFFKVLVVHGPVAGGLTVRLTGRQDKVWAHRASHAHSCSLPAGGHKALLGRGRGAVLGPFCAQGKPPDPGQETAMTTN